MYKICNKEFVSEVSCYYNELVRRSTITMYFDFKVTLFIPTKFVNYCRKSFDVWNEDVGIGYLKCENELIF